MAFVEESSIQAAERITKRIHVALPIRVTYWDGENRPMLELACTYDISARGARISGIRSIKQIGDILAIERGRSKAFCRVVWIGEPNSELRGQMGVESVESERTMWDAELRDMEEIYDPIKMEATGTRPGWNGGGNRRRLQRYDIVGLAELLNEGPNTTKGQGDLKNLSELGCLINASQGLTPGTDLKLILNVSHYDLSVKGKVRHVAPGAGIGIEFREIRKGDRQVLNYLLRKLAEEELEKSLKVEAHP
jgi:hypothetical protein